MFNRYFLSIYCTVGSDTRVNIGLRDLGTVFLWLELLVVELTLSIFAQVGWKVRVLRDPWEGGFIYCGFLIEHCVSGMKAMTCN